MKSNTQAIACCLVLIFMLVALCPGGGVAYENKDANAGPNSIAGGAHRLLNQLALERFIATAKNDPILKAYNFYPDKGKLGIKGLTVLDDPTGTWTKNLFKAEGSDVYKCGQTVADLNAIEQQTTKGFADWIIDGGYSADEPERYMSWRHFYNPLPGKGTSYFSDLPSDDSVIVDVFSAEVMGETNPHVNAKSWALSHPDNKYDWVDGANSIEAAFTQNQADQSFAVAWRSIGQTLHLLCDMTVPAHVRNDSHPATSTGLFDDARADAYEQIISADLSIIRANRNDQVANPGLAAGITSATRPNELFDMVATYVNSHFFSPDTIPYETWTGSIKDLNWDSVVFDLPDYRAPQKESKYSSNYVIQDELGTLIMYNESWLNANGWEAVPGVINKRAVESQAKRLVPVAIASSARLLDISIPRVTIDHVQFNQETITGRITRYKLQNDGTYAPSGGVNSLQRMIAFVTSSGDKQQAFLLPPVPVSSGLFTISVPDLAEYSSFVDNFVETGADIKISLGLDMGGILVRSDTVGSYTIAVDPETTTLEEGGANIFTAEVTGSIKSPWIKWSFGSGEASLEGDSNTVSHTYNTAGEFTGTAILFETSDRNKPLAQAEFKVTVAKPPSTEPDPEPDPEKPTTGGNTKPNPTTGDPADTYDYEAALAQWVKDLVARTNYSRRDEYWGQDHIYTIKFIVAPNIKVDGQYGSGVYGAHEIWDHWTYYTTDRKGQSGASTVNTFGGTHSVDGIYMSLSELRGLYPQFGK